jgi:protein-L-isoaspartate O-methyltransferase
VSIETNNIYIPGLDKSSSRLASHPCHQDRCVRGFTDEEVALLPNLPKTHPQYKHWQLRKISCQKLMRHFAFSKKALSILEVGCGNGWLSHHLASIPGHRILGLDRDLQVLQQAARVFRHQSNLKFMCGDFYSGIIQGLTFDAIIFASSIQYFPSLKDVLTAALLQLREEGEIHILDTPLSRKELAPFKYRTHFDPLSLTNRLLGRSPHLTWITICSLNLRHERNTASTGPDTGGRILL